MFFVFFCYLIQSNFKKNGILLDILIFRVIKLRIEKVSTTQLFCYQVVLVLVLIVTKQVVVIKDSPVTIQIKILFY